MGETLRESWVSFVRLRNFPCILRGFVIARLPRSSVCVLCASGANEMLGHKSFNLKLTQLNEFLIANKRETAIARHRNGSKQIKCFCGSEWVGISLRRENVSAISIVQTRNMRAPARAKEKGILVGVVDAMTYASNVLRCGRSNTDGFLTSLREWTVRMCARKQLLCIYFVSLNKYIRCQYNAPQSMRWITCALGV